MTNIFHAVIITAVVATNWTEVGTVPINGQRKSVHVGIIETNYTATVVHKGQTNTVPYQTDRAPEPLFKLSEPAPLVVITNWMPDEWRRYR